MQDSGMPDNESQLGKRFVQAFGDAAALHSMQKRKGSDIPYISHLMAVCSMVLEQGGDEDQAIAALLHDAVEDQGGQPTLRVIRRALANMWPAWWRPAPTPTRTPSLPGDGERKSISATSGRLPQRSCPSS